MAFFVHWLRPDKQDEFPRPKKKEGKKKKTNSEIFKYTLSGKYKQPSEKHLPNFRTEMNREGSENGKFYFGESVDIIL